MTREEAIDIIKCLAWHRRPDEEDIEQAIKSLSAKPCDDVISRKAALDCLTATKLKKFDFILHARAEIKKLPPVTPQPKMGRWIGHREHCEKLGVMPSGLGAYKWCSNCDCGIDVREWHRNNYNFCPNCGAKMESEDE